MLRKTIQKNVELKNCPYVIMYVAENERITTIVCMVKMSTRTPTTPIKLNVWKHK